MKKYVLDASVILKFLLAEDKQIEKKLARILEQAKAKKIILYSSVLLPLEVGNGLRYTLQDIALAAETYDKFLKLPINYWVFTSVQQAKILALSYTYKVSVYDASYHFLAKILQGVFLTADRKYYQQAKDWGDIQLF